MYYPSMLGLKLTHVSKRGPLNYINVSTIERRLITSTTYRHFDQLFIDTQNEKNMNTIYTIESQKDETN